MSENFISSWVNRYINPFLERHFELRIDFSSATSRIPSTARKVVFPSSLTKTEVDKLFPEKRYKLNKNVKRRFSVCSVDSDVHSSNNECCICLGNIAEGCKIRTLRCQHFYHSECISRWLQVNATCPLCRKNSFRGKQGVLTSLRRSFTV